MACPDERGSDFVLMRTVTKKNCAVFMVITAHAGTLTWVWVTSVPEVFLLFQMMAVSPCLFLENQ